MEVTNSLEEENECPICYHLLTADQPYAMIDNTGEKGMYHIECLEKWLEKSKNGLITNNLITSYSVYHEGELIETKMVTTNIDIIDITDNQDQDQDQDQTNDQQSTPLISDSSSPNRDPRCYCLGRIVACVFSCILISSVFFFLYRLV
jgi:hypothetical protein